MGVVCGGGGALLGWGEGEEFRGESFISDWTVEAQRGSCLHDLLNV